MFEKEAYEYAKTKIDLATSMMNPQIESATRLGFREGAEYGYKYKENEWHYAKEELPPEDVPILCVRGGKVYVAWFILGKWKGDKYNDVKKPYAWKEVKLPEPGLQMPMQEG